MVYRTIEELLFIIRRPVNRVLLDVLHAHKDRFLKAQGSSVNHQAWEGGYLDHVVDAMNIARLLYADMNGVRPLPFALDEALTVIFLHDLEKAWPELINERAKFGEPRPKAKSKVRYELLHDLKLWDYLSNVQKNAIDHIEGEGDSYTNKQRIMGPLATFCHMCDVASARLWFDRPAEEENESWGWRESIAYKERIHAAEEKESRDQQS